MVGKDLILSIHLTLLCLQLRSLASFGQHINRPSQIPQAALTSHKWQGHIYVCREGSIRIEIWIFSPGYVPSEVSNLLA